MTIFNEFGGMKSNDLPLKEFVMIYSSVMRINHHKAKLSSFTNAYQKFKGQTFLQHSSVMLPLISEFEVSIFCSKQLNYFCPYIKLHNKIM